MKKITLLIISYLVCCFQYSNAQISSQIIGSATVSMGSNFLNNPITEIQKVSTGGNAKYVKNGSQIKVYVFETLPKISNWSAYLQEIDNVRPFQTKTVLGDTFFNLENHTLGILAIDATVQNRKTLVYQENQVLVLTCELVISQPKQPYYFDFPSCNNTFPLKGAYNWQNAIESKAYLIHQSTNQIFQNQLSKIWTDGQSAFIKTGMISPEGGSMNIEGTSINMNNYSLMGYINLKFTGAKPVIYKVYYVKYKLENIAETFILKIDFVTGTCPDNKQPDSSTLNLNPHP